MSNLPEGMVAAYIATALWSSLDDDGAPLDAQYGVEDFDPEALLMLAEDCVEFLSESLTEIGPELLDHWALADLAYDFWLTRNGHGTGFWDRTDQPHWETLDRIARKFGEQDVYVGDDGRLYVYP